MTKGQKGVLLLGVVLCVASLQTLVFGRSTEQPFLINVTESAPYGVYRRTVFARLPSVGDWVISPAPPESGHTRLLKKVVAVAPSHVLAEDGLVLIDGVRIADAELESGPVIEEFDRKLVGREAWLQNEHPRSWDSRYFGPVSLDDVVRVKEVVTW